VEFFFKNQKLIFRVAGSMLLFIGFVLYFWVMPKQGISENDRAAANVARMEAKVKGTSSKSAKEAPDSSKFLDKLKQTQEKQSEYALILAMVFGVGFLGYSFIKKEDA
jgi:energy-converting hydrogenase Eha subunit F